MSKKMLTSLLAVVILTSLLLGACQPAPTAEPTKAPDKPAATQPPAATQAPAKPATDSKDPYANVDPNGQTVIFWHNHTKEREDALKAIVDDFNKTNKYGVTVKAEYQGSYADIFKKMLPILNTPDAPGIVVAYQNQAATYQLSKALVDMNPLVNSAKWGLTEAEQKDFFSGFWAQDVFPNFENARLGFPPNRSMEVLYYNIDWLKELGYDKPPQTPDQFKEMACKAAKTPYTKSKVKGSMGYELSIDMSRMASWTFAFGGDVFDYKNGQYTLNSEAAVKAMTFLQDLVKSGCATQVTEAYGDQTDFGQGKLLFSIGSTSGLPFYAKASKEGAGHNFSAGPLPYTTKEPVMNIYGASVSLTKAKPEKELAAWLFLKYYTSPDVQAKWATVSQYYPVRASVVEKMQPVLEKDPVYKSTFDLLKYGRFEPPTPGYDFVREMAGKAMAAIIAEPYPNVKTTLDKLNTDANANLKEQMAQMKK